ncbi:hypothetical protein [Halocola ammonii]
MKKSILICLAFLFSLSAFTQNTLDLEFNEIYYSCSGNGLLITEYCDGTDDNYHFSWQKQVSDEWTEVDADCQLNLISENSQPMADTLNLRLQVTYTFTDDTTTSEPFALVVFPQFEWEFEIGDVNGDAMGCEISFNAWINSNSTGFDTYEIAWTSENLDWSMTSSLQFCFDPISSGNNVGLVYANVCEGAYGCCVGDTAFVVFSDNGNGIWGNGDELIFQNSAPPGFDEGSTNYGDIDENGIIDAADLVLFLAEYGCEGDCEIDFNSDELLNTEDFLLFLSNFGAEGF